MILRRWISNIETARADEYERFAREISLPMFREQPGFMAAIMARDGDYCTVLTIWDTPEAVTALEFSQTYRQTVESLNATGLLRGHQRVETAQVHVYEIGG